MYIYKHIPLLISLVIHETQMQTSLPSESANLLILFHPSTRDLQTLNPKSADSLSELSQICATCSMARIKPSDVFPDQVLRSKQSPFYETFWMNSAILNSSYALVGSTATTSGYSFSSSSKIA